MMFTSKITGLSAEISDQQLDLNISLYESFCYCFNYAGVLSGPYYTFKTYHDHLYLPFGSTTTIRRRTYLKYVTTIIISALISFIVGNVWPVSYASSSGFYEKTSFFYRLFYMIPLYIEFRTKMYANNKFAEIILITAGLGVYPKISHPKCGHGPTTKITDEMLKKSASLEMDYETVNTVNIYGFELHPTFRVTVKDHWNKCVQFWLYRTVYSRLPLNINRLLVTQLISSYWHGLHSGYFFTILTLVVYIPLENFYLDLLSKHDSMSSVKNIISLAMKIFVLHYMNVAFSLKDFDKFWKFYGSIYHIGYVLYFLLAVGYYVSNRKKNTN